MATASRQVQELRWSRRFLATVFSIWIGTTIAFGVTTVNWTQTISLVQFSLIIFFLFSFSFAFSKRLYSLLLPPYPLRALDHVPGSPKVAILYTTMNDVVPECLGAIRQTYPCDVFILDDSSDESKRAVVDAFAVEAGSTVIRRPERLGFKAGALNNWLRLHGNAYDYFVLLDADSFLPPDWVEHALRYAEHPDNRDLAVFQGMINIWNRDRPFTAALAPMNLLSHDEWERKLANYLGAVVCYGHNVMIRVAPVLEIGGFDEGFVSEDFATAVRLASNGYGSAFVPLHSWEALPENVRGFVRRQNKWTRGSMEFFSFVPPARIPWHKKLILLMIPWGHLAYVAIMAAIFLAVFGRISSLTAFMAFGQNLATAPIEYIWSIPLFRFIIVLTLVTASFTVAKLLQVRLPLLTFYRARILSKAIGSIMLPHEVRSMLLYVLDRRRRFPVTPKDEPPMTMREILGVGRWTVLLIFVVGAGLLLVNPVGLYYNMLWLLPFSASPLLLYYYCGPRMLPSRVRNGGSVDLTSDSKLRTAVDRHQNRW